MNYKRKRPRSQPTHGWRNNSREYKYNNWMGHWPRWWDVVFHTKPARARSRAKIRAVLIGREDADNATWEPHHKPHKYYW